MGEDDDQPGGRPELVWYRVVPPRWNNEHPIALQGSGEIPGVLQ